MSEVLHYAQKIDVALDFRLVILIAYLYGSGIRLTKAEWKEEKKNRDEVWSQDEGARKRH